MAELTITLEEIPEEISVKLSAKLVEELGFYFDDDYLSKDQLMREEMMKNDGWLPVETLLNLTGFKEIFVDTKPEEASKSLISCVNQMDSLQVDSDGKMIRPYPTLQITKIPAEEMSVKLSKQLEFYFGNVNLFRDRFMKEVMIKNDGWFPVETLLTLTGFKEIFVDTKPEEVSKSLISCANQMDSLQVDSDRKMIRPNPTLQITKIPAEEMSAKLSEQLGFYFGNVNLFRDRFMKEVMMKNDGWFPVETLLTFNRMKELFQECKPEEALKAIIDCARQLHLLEVHSDGQMIRRDPSVKFPISREATTLVVKGFKIGVTVDDMIEFFKKYSGFQGVVMRTYQEKLIEDKKESAVSEMSFKKKFKGSVFVIFDTVENAQECLEALKNVQQPLDLLDLLESEAPFEVLWQADHKMMKKEKVKEKIELKRKLATKDDDFNIILNTVVNITNVPEDVTREQMKESWMEAVKDCEDGENMKIAFIDYNLGKINGSIRLSNPAADKAVQFMQGKLVFRGKPPVVLTKLEPQVEEKYLKEVAVLKAERNKTKFPRFHRGRGRGFRR